MTEEYPIEYDEKLMDKQRDAVNNLLELFPHANLDQDPDGYYLIWLNWQWDPEEAEEE